MLKVNSSSCLVCAKFFVFAKDEREYETIVGRQLAIKLGILEIGDNIAEVCHLCIKERESKSSGNSSDVQLSIPLNSSVHLVA